MSRENADVVRALIVGNGERPSPALWEELMASAPLVLCADGGANTVHAYGVTPHAIVGDLDSLAPEIQKDIPTERLVRVDADNTGTDVQKVLHYAKGIGVQEAVLVGFTGGRTDHWLWNLSMLKVFGPSIALRIVDNYCEVRLVQDVLRLCACIGQKISLSPLGGAVEGIETSGLKFPLEGESLASGVRDGISNEVVGNPVEIRVGRGDLLVIVQREELLGPVCWNP